MVTTGQTHTMSVHSKFYVMKKRKLEEAHENEKVYEKHCNKNPLPLASILDEDNLSSIQTPISQNSSVSTSATFNTTIDPSVIQDINETYEFGTARQDINKKGKRFDWTDQEISHLQYFIIHIEPTLSESERKNKYASCLNYLKRADATIQQDFHPFHCENSGRVKTGYEVALKRLG